LVSIGYLEKPTLGINLFSFHLLDVVSLAHFILNSSKQMAREFHKGDEFWL
jgi:hypothetical protein